MEEKKKEQHSTRNCVLERGAMFKTAIWYNFFISGHLNLISQMEVNVVLLKYSMFTFKMWYRTLIPPNF